MAIFNSYVSLPEGNSIVKIFSLDRGFLSFPDASPVLIMPPL